MKNGKIDVIKLIDESGAMFTGHFVYKSGKHSTGYIDKEQFASLGATKYKALIEAIGENAVEKGLTFPKGVKEIGIIGPAMGAILLAFPLAAYLEQKFPQYKFFPARSELDIDATGNKTHVIPEKLMPLYKDKNFIIIEDIVNSGTSVREIIKLLNERASTKVFAVLSIVNRGGQTAEDLGVKQYYPLKISDMPQHDPKDCPECAKGNPIDEVLGKGKRWVKLFGEPPYSPKADFSEFYN
jgi:orotate phosphoribosyltransferase